MGEPEIIGPFLAAGTRVCLANGPDDRPKFGTVIHCWVDEECWFHDCYVAFFGNELPSSNPPMKPYVLRYATTSLDVRSSPPTIPGGGVKP